MQSNIKLVVIKDALDYAQTNAASHTERGDDLFLMLKNIYPDNIPTNTRWYLDKWDTQNDVTPQDADDIKKLNEIGGTIYVVTYPGDPITAIVIAVSIVVSVAVAFLMPMPTVPGSGAPATAPSPNNALAQRTNRQRLGGRVPAIYGEVRSIPDLVAQNYSVYIDHQEIEYSAMCIGEGYYEVSDAKDGETSIALIDGANVRVYNPGLSTITDDPTFEFGNSLTTKELEYDGLAPKRYSSINGQVLTYPEDYLICDDNIIFEPPNIVRISSGTFDTTIYKTGEVLQVESADGISAPSGKKYNLSGFYTILNASSTEITLRSPNLVNTDWVTLQNFDSQTNASSLVLSTEAQPLWQGWHYIENNELDIALLNFSAAQGIYTISADGERFSAFNVGIIVDVQGLDESLQPYPDNIAKFEYRFDIYGRTAKLNAAGNQYTFTTSEDARRSAAKTQKIALFQNPGGSRLRVRRFSARQNVGKQAIYDEVKFVDLYASKNISNSEHNQSELSTLVKTKTKATEGATSLKERKLSALVKRRVSSVINTPYKGNVQRFGYDSQGSYITLDRTVDFNADNAGRIILSKNDRYYESKCYKTETGRYQSSVLIQDDIDPYFLDSLPEYQLVIGDNIADTYFDKLLNPSKRIDDIIYHIATSPTTGGLSPNDLNMAQITAEVDAQIAYFGTDLCAQFCGTFDSTDISTEEMIQTVAGAGFFTAYRINNKIHLHFERKELHSTVSFNSHNIMPDSFEYAESFGSRDGYDAVEVTYTSPIDDAKLTMLYPTNGGTKLQKIELVGVRNNVQAHMHMMRAYQKNIHSYKTCEFVGIDESAIVLPTNRIDVANQHRSDTQQGSITGYTKLDDQGKKTLHLSSPVFFDSSQVGTLYVQTTDAIVDRYTVFQSTNGDDHSVTIAANSANFNENISIGNENVVSATYRFVPSITSGLEKDSYIVTKKDPAENPFAHRLSCVNYSDKYYQYDQDFTKGFVTSIDKRG